MHKQEFIIFIIKVKTRNNVASDDVNHFLEPYSLFVLSYI